MDLLTLFTYKCFSYHSYNLQDMIHFSEFLFNSLNNNNYYYIFIISIFNRDALKLIFDIFVVFYDFLDNSDTNLKPLNPQNQTG